MENSIPMDTNSACTKFASSHHPYLLGRRVNKCHLAIPVYRDLAPSRHLQKNHSNTAYANGNSTVLVHESNISLNSPYLD
jgi:hypothetical protein